MVARSAEWLPTEWLTWGSEFESQWAGGGQELSLFSTVQTYSGAHPASCPVGTRGSFPGVKWPGIEAYHASPTSAKGKKTWIYTFNPHISSWCSA
jgi:hypothetical protein